MWARFLMSSVAMIYFARLFLAALAHRQNRPQEFEEYRMPKWWGMYRHLGAWRTVHFMICMRMTWPVCHADDVPCHLFDCLTSGKCIQSVTTSELEGDLSARPDVESIRSILVCERTVVIWDGALELCLGSIVVAYAAVAVFVET